MGLNRIAEYCAGYVKAYGKNVTKIIQTQPIRNVEFEGLKYFQLAEDKLVLSKNRFKLPTKEELKTLLEKQGIKRTDRIYKANGELASFGNQDVQIINDNNAIFLEELSRMFPKRADEEVNTALQKRMLYLQDIDHSTFPDKQKFLEQFLKDVEDVENLLAKDGKKLYSNSTVDLYSKKAILQAKYNNPERYKELNGLIGLYQRGLIPRHNVQIFFPEGHFHPLIKSDMAKLLNNENYFPQFSKFVEEDIAKVEFGEVFSVGEKMFVKTKDGYEALKIDKRTYEKLFPPVERYSPSQNNAGNCGKIASWNAMIKNPNSRIEIYRLFEQTPNGVRVNIPYKNYSKEFNWNDLSELNTDKNIQGCLGHKMAELAHDIAHTGQLSTAGNPYPLLITHITGKPEVTRFYTDQWLTLRANKELKEQYIKMENNGIYVKNGNLENLNKGDTDGHFYSTTDLTTGLWQNPWSGVEEMSLGRGLPYSGSMHSYSTNYDLSNW